MLSSPWVEVSGEVGPANSNMPEMVLQELMAGQNHFEADDNNEIDNHNENLVEENDNEVHPHEFLPHGQDDQNQNVAANQEDMESDDDSFMEGM